MNYRLTSSSGTPDPPSFSADQMGDGDICICVDNTHDCYGHPILCVDIDAGGNYLWIDLVEPVSYVFNYAPAFCVRNLKNGEKYVIEGKG